MYWNCRIEGPAVWLGLSMAVEEFVCWLLRLIHTSLGCTDLTLITLQSIDMNWAHTNMSTSAHTHQNCVRHTHTHQRDTVGSNTHVQRHTHTHKLNTFPEHAWSTGVFIGWAAIQPWVQEFGLSASSQDTAGVSSAQKRQSRANKQAQQENPGPNQ